MSGSATSMLDLPKQPHPMTGEPFVEGKIRHHEERHRYDALPPLRPSRAVYEWDEDVDDDVFIRDLTEEEYATALEAWRRADAEWTRTGGVSFSRGPSWHEGEFWTASGARVKALLRPDGQWSITEADAPGRHTPYIPR